MENLRDRISYALFYSRSCFTQVRHRRLVLRNVVMRFLGCCRARRVLGRKKLACLVCLAVVVVVFYRLIDKHGPHFERQPTCEELGARERLIQLCTDFHKGDVGGNLCSDLCISHELVLQECLAHKNTTIVFAGKWKNVDVVFKTKREPHHFETLKDLLYYDLQDDEGQADHSRIPELFRSHVFEHVKNELSYYELGKIMTPQKVLQLLWNPHKMRPLSWAEMSSLWLLIQRDEFIKMQFLQGMKHIPRLYGFCGRFYAVERVETLEQLSFSPFRKPMPWKKRLKVALDFLDLSKEFLSSALGNLHHCDIQPGNFGITKDMNVVALDIDTVFTTKQIEDFLEQPTCETNKECDFFDCVSACNKTAHHCMREILTNNLQVLCRDILNSYWGMPGLLQRPPINAQQKISSVLLECASETSLPWKQSKREAMRNKLHRILTAELMAN